MNALNRKFSNVVRSFCLAILRCEVPIVQRMSPSFVNLAVNPFLCDALRVRKTLLMRTQSLMQEDCLLQSNRLRVFYRGVNYSGVMTPDSILCCLRV